MHAAWDAAEPKPCDPAQGLLNLTLLRGPAVRTLPAEAAAKPSSARDWEVCVLPSLLGAGPWAGCQESQLAGTGPAGRQLADAASKGAQWCLPGAACRGQVRHTAGIAGCLQALRAAAGAAGCAPAELLLSPSVAAVQPWAPGLHSSSY